MKLGSVGAGGEFRLRVEFRNQKSEFRNRLDAGWSSPVARWAHNPKVAGSNPAPATNFRMRIAECGFRISKSAIRNPQSEIRIGGVAQLAEHRVCNAGVRGSNPLTSTSGLPTCDCRMQIGIWSELEGSSGNLMIVRIILFAL